MNGVISWNGQRSDQFGITVEKYPGHTKPERKRETFAVPGRNGDIVLMQDAWENVQQKYEIFAGNGKRGAVSGGFSRVADWLYGPSGYCELWDDFDPDHYRLAYFTGPFDVEPSLVGRTGRATISFTCKPQRFLMIGKNPVAFSASGTIINPTPYKARPLIKITKSSGSGSGTVTVNGTVFTISSVPSVLYIDCDEMTCYDSNGINRNSIVTSSTSEFAVLDSGENGISFTGRIASVEIVPNWFEI